MQIEFEGDNFADVGDDNRVILLTHTDTNPHTGARYSHRYRSNKKKAEFLHTHRYSYIHMHAGTVKNKQVMRKIQNPHCLRKGGRKGGVVLG